MKTVFANPRVMSILFLLVVILSMICMAFYTFGAPRLDIMATATSAFHTQVAVTSTYDAQVFVLQTNEAADIQTLTAMPTVTPTITPSLTPTPSSTPTPTATATPVMCDIKTGAGIKIYSAPSMAMSSIVSPHDTTKLMWRAGNTSWYVVESPNEYRWVNFYNIYSDEQSNCIGSVRALPLDVLLGLDQQGEIVIDDDFSKQSFWVDDKDKLLSSIPDLNAQTYGLILASYTTQPDSNPIKKQVFLQNHPLSGSFAFLSSYEWSYSGEYFALRFWDDGVNYYEIRVTSSCRLDLYDTGNLLMKKETTLTADKCRPGMKNYLRFEVKPDGVATTLTVWLNNALPTIFDIPHAYDGDGFSWYLSNTGLKVEYVVLVKHNNP